MHHFILDFTTACDSELNQSRYSYAEVSSATKYLSNGAGNGSNFYLLPTQCYDKSLYEGLTDYILNYEEFRQPEYEPILRRGRKENVIRSCIKYTQISIDNNV